MRFLKERAPTKHEAALLFVVCVFLTHVWTMLHFLREVPAYLRRMDLFDVLGVLAYTQVFALLESIVFLGLFVLISIALPIRLFKDKFVAQGTILMFTTFLWGAPAYYQARIMQWLSPGLTAYIFLVGFWIISYFAVNGGLLILIRRDKKVDDSINAFVERLAVLSSVYLLVDILSIFIIIYRNLV